MNWLSAPAPNRRRVLRHAMLSLAGVAGAGGLQGVARAAMRPYDDDHAGMVLNRELGAEHVAGATLRIVARSSVPPMGSGHAWHPAPDGGACFGTDDGGWVYVSNSEMYDGKGGVGALRFAADGSLVDAYPILAGTTRNCAGGKTPWGTWLSCEESGDFGRVFECDPLGTPESARRWDALGAFNHEAAAFDEEGRVYLSEDRSDGLLYRFTPAVKGDLSDGLLEAAVEAGPGRVGWAPVPDPSAASMPTRRQVSGGQRFAGGEGLIFDRGMIYLATKKDNRVWRLDVATGSLDVVYDAATSDNPILTGVDNLELSPGGELLVAEDGGDMQIVVLDADYRPKPLITLYGQEKSEICGPAFSPDGRRLYFSSQGGFSGKSEDGITYELAFDEPVTVL